MDPAYEDRLSRAKALATERRVRELADAKQRAAAAELRADRAEASAGRRSRPSRKISAPSIELPRGRAKQQVTLSIAGTAAVVLTDRIVHGRYGTAGAATARQIVGLVVVFIVLGFVADLAPQVAGPLALLIFLTVLATLGPEIFGQIEKATGGKPQPARDRKKKKGRKA